MLLLLYQNNTIFWFILTKKWMYFLYKCSFCLMHYNHLLVCFEYAVKRRYWCFNLLKYVKNSIRMNLNMHFLALESFFTIPQSFGFKFRSLILKLDYINWRVFIFSSLHYYNNKIISIIWFGTYRDNWNTECLENTQTIIDF